MKRAVASFFRAANITWRAPDKLCCSNIFGTPTHFVLMHARIALFPSAPQSYSAGHNRLEALKQLIAEFNRWNADRNTEPTH
jgi:hypothetical protein